MKNIVKKKNISDYKRESLTKVQLTDTKTGEPLDLVIHGHPKMSRAYLAISAKYNPPTKQRLYTGRQSYMDIPPANPDIQLKIDAEAVTAITDADGVDIDGIEINTENMMTLFKDKDYEFIGIQWQLHLNEEKND